MEPTVEITWSEYYYKNVEFKQRFEKKKDLAKLTGFFGKASGR